MAVTIHKNKVVFLRTLTEGSTDESYGIEVARQAGIPQTVIRRADQLKREMKVLSLKHQKDELQNSSESEQKTDEIFTELSTLNLDDMTPKQALKKLEELQEKLS
jgi:DNA mismatch repair protein MutS